MNKCQILRMNFSWADRPPYAILVTFPNRSDPLSFLRGGGRLMSSVYYRHKRCS